MKDLSKRDVAALLDQWHDADRDRVANLIQQNRELTEEVMRQDDALLDAYDRIEELADLALTARRERRDWAALFWLVAGAAAFVIGTRGLS